MMNSFSGLYNLMPEDVTEQIVNKQHFLVVKYYWGKDIGIHLRALIPKELLLKDGILVDYDKLSLKQKDDILNLLKGKLSFSVHEIYMFNILLDNFIRNNSNEIKFSDIHVFYREKSIRKGHSIEPTTMQCYTKALIDLAEKDIYCITSSNFRKANYGVNDKEFYGNLVELISFIPRDDKGDVIIKYSLGEFGNILKKSKRYGCLVPSKVFTFKFRSNLKYMIAMNLARAIFVKRLNKKNYEYCTIKVRDLLNFPAFDKKCQNTNRILLEKVYSYKYKQKIKRMHELVRCIDVVLLLFKRNNVIVDYDICTDKKYFGITEFENLEIMIDLNIF